MFPENNTEVVREILRNSDIAFEPLSPPHTDEWTSVSFSYESAGTWSCVISTDNEHAKIGFYSFLLQLPEWIDDGRVLRLINQVNLSLLFESHVDYIQNTKTIRFKANFTRLGSGLPLTETREAVTGHLARSAYLHHLFHFAVFNVGDWDAASAINQAHIFALQKSNNTAPHFF